MTSGPVLTLVVNKRNNLVGPKLSENCKEGKHWLGWGLLALIKVSAGAVIKNANLFHLYPQFNFWGF